MLTQTVCWVAKSGVVCQLAQMKGGSALKSPLNRPGDDSPAADRAALDMLRMLAPFPLH